MRATGNGGPHHCIMTVNLRVTTGLLKVVKHKSNSTLPLVGRMCTVAGGGLLETAQAHPVRTLTSGDSLDSLPIKASYICCAVPTKHLHTFAPCSGSAGFDADLTAGESHPYCPAFSLTMALTPYWVASARPAGPEPAYHGAGVGAAHLPQPPMNSVSPVNMSFSVVPSSLQR